MARLQVLLLTFFCIAIVLASPIQQKQKQKRSFKIPRIPNPNYKPNGKRAYKRALFKFGLGDISFRPDGEVATKIKASTAAVNTTEDEQGETTAAPTQDDAQFLSPVTVGGQQLIMNFDSGSSDTWVFNTKLPAASQQGHTIYDPTKSTTFQNLDGTFNVSYGDGSFCSGPVGLETVDIGGATVSAQAIGLPNVVSDSFVTGSAANGLVGLAFSKLNTIRPQQQKTFFDNIMSDLTLPVFTAQLLSGKVGSYEFGRIDSTAFVGNLTTVAVDSSQGFWQIQSAAAKVGGKTTAIPNGSAIIDTGTSLMLVGDEMLVAYWNNVQGAQLSQQAGGVIFPCNSALPDLQVAVGPNYFATVKGDVMNFAQVGTDRTTGTDFCFGGLQSSQGLPFAIYGDVFLRSQFVAFDGSGPSVGIAPHA